MNENLIGKWFHSFNKEGIVSWQGQVLSMQKDGIYLVQLYSWIMGEESDQVLVKIEDMLNWSFYKTSEDMNFAYTHKHEWKVKERAKKS